MADQETEISFAEPALQMTCADPASKDEAAISDWNRYYTEVHQPDLLRNNPGMRRAWRYEMTTPDPSGVFGPRFLAIYEWKSVHDARVFVVRGEDPDGSWRPDYLPQPPVWGSVGRGPQQWGRLMCERLGESDPPSAAPAAILMEGLNPPAGASEAEVNEFRDFFANHHELTIDRDTSYRRVTKYELLDLGFRIPPPGTHPQFLAIYEADEATEATISKSSPKPQSVTGPALWERREMAWQHVYRRISNATLPGARYTAAILR